jgi:hypothetical protein
MKKHTAQSNPLGKQKQQLLDRLSRVGAVFVNPITEDDFTQMTVPQCRKFVVGVENFLAKLAREIA